MVNLFMTAITDTLPSRSTCGELDDNIEVAVCGDILLAVAEDSARMGELKEFRLMLSPGIHVMGSAFTSTFSKTPRNYCASSGPLDLAPFISRRNQVPVQVPP